MAIKLLAFCFVATVVSDQLQHQLQRQWLLREHWASFLGLAGGVLVQQAIPPRAPLAKFLLLLLPLVPISYMPDVMRMIARA